ncbi:MAG TPA: PHP domain-containing protein [Thermoanaerobaculia bacterium]|nr:PHP domain-containing protein [Thermoanaerobaculia bacterium]
MLLADFHIHTNWSDGKLSMPEVVDLFGRGGHDVIAITDHVVNTDSLIGKATHEMGLSITSRNFAAYRDEIEREKRRAWDEYRMIVLAGFELTQNAVMRRNSAHVLALGVEELISADGTVEQMLERAQRMSKVVVACHPNEQSDWFANTFYIWNRRNVLAELVDPRSSSSTPSSLPCWQPAAASRRSSRPSSPPGCSSSRSSTARYVPA